MATSGVNLTFGNTKSVWSDILRILALRPAGWEKRRQNMCVKAGAPVTDAAGDDPLKKGVMCLDTTNDDVYLNTAYTDSTTHTWTKLN